MVVALVQRLSMVVAEGVEVAKPLPVPSATVAVVVGLPLALPPRTPTAIMLAVEAAVAEAQRLAAGEALTPCVLLPAAEKDTVEEAETVLQRVAVVVGSAVPVWEALTLALAH